MDTLRLQPAPQRDSEGCQPEKNPLDKTLETLVGTLVSAFGVRGRLPYNSVPQCG